MTEVSKYAFLTTSCAALQCKHSSSSLDDATCSALSQQHQAAKALHVSLHATHPAAHAAGRCRWRWGAGRQRGEPEGCGSGRPRPAGATAPRGWALGGGAPGPHTHAAPAHPLRAPRVCQLGHALEGLVTWQVPPSTGSAAGQRVLPCSLCSALPSCVAGSAASAAAGTLARDDRRTCNLVGGVDDDHAQVEPAGPPITLNGQLHHTAVFHGAQENLFVHWMFKKQILGAHRSARMRAMSRSSVVLPARQG